MKNLEKELLEMAGSIDLSTDISAAFAEMENKQALEAIEARLRETRSFIQVMEDKIYAAKRALRTEVVS